MNCKFFNVVFIIILLSMIASCSGLLIDKETINNVVEDKLPSVFDFAISRDEAIEAAYAHFGREISKSSIGETGSLEYDEKEIAYYVNMPDGGWAIVSGDKRMQTILAFCDEGVFDPEDIDTGTQLWLKEIGSELWTLKSDETIMTDSPYLKKWHKHDNLEHIVTKGGGEDDHEGQWLQTMYVCQNRILEVDEAHILPTKWAQGDPWNGKLPYKVSNPNERVEAGCVTIALAQLMYYLHTTINRPEFVPECYCNGNEDNFSMGITGYSDQWTGMPMEIYTFNNSEIENKNAVCNLISGVLQLVQLQYNNSRPNAFIQYILAPDRPLGSAGRTAVKGFLNQQWIQCSQWNTFDPEIAINQVANRMPVLMSSFNNSNGHAWLIDGGRKYSTYEVYYNQWVPMGTFPPVEPVAPDWDNLDQYVISETCTGIEYYFQMNWGFGATNHTYYYYGSNWVIDLGNNTSYNATYDRQMIYGFSSMNQ